MEVGQGVRITRMLGMQVIELAERQATINIWILTTAAINQAFLVSQASFEEFIFV